MQPLLTALGVRYALHVSGPHEHAMFAYGETDVQFSVVHLEPAILRVTALALLAGDASLDRLRRIDTINRQWGFGRLFHAGRDERYDAAAAVYLGVGVDARRCLEATLDHLAGAGPALARYEAPALITAVPKMPSLQAVADLIRADGLSPLIRDDRVGVRIAIPGGPDLILEVAIAGMLWRVDAVPFNPIPLPDDLSTHQRLQMMNGGLSYGTMTFDAESGRIVYSIANPIGWAPLDAGLVRGWIGKAASVIAMLDADLRSA